MSALVFTFTADASGSKDPCTIPANANYAGYRTLKVRPPNGHAWSYSTVPTAAGTSVTMGIDEMLTFKRGSGEFSGGEIPLYIATDTGTGTFTGILE